MQNKFQEIKNLLASAEADANKFYEKGNNAAGSRLRKAFMDIAKAAKDGRKEVTDLKAAKKA